MKLTKAKIFITGGEGFIGSHLVDLLAKENSITVYDNGQSAVNYRSPQKTVTYTTGDIRDIKTQTKAMKGHDVVIAMAAAHLRVSMGSPMVVHDINATGTLVSLLAARTNHIKRVTYISSSEVYGTAQNPKDTMDEQHPTRPTTVYGLSKYVGELYARQFQQQEGIPTIIVRPFNTYGPRSHFESYYGEVIPRMTIRALCGLPPIIFGNGKQSRDFTYVEDTARGIVQATECDTLIGDTVNIAYGKEITVKEIASIILKHTNQTHLHILSKPIRPNDVTRHAADTSKAQRLFSWKPEIAIEQGIAQYVDWVKQNYRDLPSQLKKIPNQNW